MSLLDSPLRLYSVSIRRRFTGTESTPCHAPCNIWTILAGSFHSHCNVDATYWSGCVVPLAVWQLNNHTWLSSFTVCDVDRENRSGRRALRHVTIEQSQLALLAYTLRWMQRHGVDAMLLAMWSLNISFFDCTQLHSDIKAKTWSGCRASSYVTIEHVAGWLYSVSRLSSRKALEWMWWL